MKRFGLLALTLAVLVGLPSGAWAGTAEDLELVKEKYDPQKRVVVENGRTEINQHVGTIQPTSLPVVGNQVELPPVANANPHNSADYNQP